MTSSSSVRSVRFDESRFAGNNNARRTSRISGRLSAAPRYPLFSQKSLAQIMKDRMLECHVELSIGSGKDDRLSATASAAMNYVTDQGSERGADSENLQVFYRTSNSKPGLHHSWGYQSGDPIIPERDFRVDSNGSSDVHPLEASTLSIKVYARTPPADTDNVGPQRGAQTAKADAPDWKLVCQTSADLRDLEPLPGNMQSVNLSLPPNSILLGLAPGANSLSGRANIASSDSYRNMDSEASEEAKSGPKLNRSTSEREAERTQHILESIVYYVVPLHMSQKLDAAHAIGAVSTIDEAADASRGHRNKDGSSSHSPTLFRHTSLDHYASDPESAPSRKAVSAPASEQVAATLDSLALPSVAIAATPDARRRERRKAFEDEQRRVLELSLRETKMMPSYTLNDAKHVAKKQAELQHLSDQVQELRRVNGDLLSEVDGFVQLRLRYEQQKARYSAVRQMALDEADQLQRKRTELTERKAALEARRRAILASQSLFEAVETTSRQLKEDVQTLNIEKAHVALQLHVQQASMLRDLEAIFPIELSDASSLLFSICGLPLPNAVPSIPASELANEERRWKDTIKRHVPASTRPVFHPFDDETISSALGLVAQLVMLLSTYLATPIHYPLATAGSRAVVQDGISLMSGPRAFPLYAKGMERYRYEYAAFLLNKDIEQLMNVHSVTVIDIRHTLPNLKNLMVTVAAAPPTSQMTRKSHIGKSEIALRSTPPVQRNVDVTNGNVKKSGLEIGLGLPSVNAGAKLASAGGVRNEVVHDMLVTTRVLGAPSTATTKPATANGAIASVSRALSYFSGGNARS